MRSANTSRPGWRTGRSGPGPAERGCRAPAQEHHRYRVRVWRLLRHVLQRHFLRRHAELRAAEPITIGAVLPLSGDAARWGIPPRNAADLAIDEINGAGGIDGRTLRLMAEDDRCQPADGVAAFNKIMAAVTTPVILGAVCSSSTLTIAPLAEASKTVLISPASTSPKVTNAGDFVF